MQQFRHAFFAYKHFFADCIVIHRLSLSRMIRNKHNIVYVTYCLSVCSIASYRNWVHIYITPTGSDKCTQQHQQQQQQLSALSTTLGSMLSVVLRAWAYERAFLSLLSLPLCFCLSVLSLSALRWLSTSRATFRGGPLAEFECVKCPNNGELSGKAYFHQRATCEGLNWFVYNNSVSVSNALPSWLIRGRERRANGQVRK